MKAVVVVASLAACASPPPTVPSGPHYTYVLDHVTVPTSTSEARQYALDLNGDRTVDNELGEVFATATSMGFDTTKATQSAVDSGAIALIADLQTPDLVSTKAAGFTLLFGEHQPDNTYTLAADTPTDTPIVGGAEHSIFSLGPGELDVRVAFIDPALVITLPLEHARVELDNVTTDGVMLGVVAGAIPRVSLNSVLVPSVATAFQELVTRDCGHPNGMPCGCLQGSLGATVIDQFDTAPDCIITDHEVVANDLIISLLAPDLTYDGTPYISLGLGFTAVATRLD